MILQKVANALIAFLACSSYFNSDHIVIIEAINFDNWKCDAIK